MSFKVNGIIILILFLSFIINLFNIYGWFYGRIPGQIEFIASIAVVVVWFISSLYMGYKSEGIFLVFLLMYWGLGIVLAGVSYLLNLFQVEFSLIIAVIICFMYTGQLYGIGYEISPNVYFNPSIGIVLVGAVGFITIILFFIGAIIKKKLSYSRS